MTQFSNNETNKFNTEALLKGPMPIRYNCVFAVFQILLLRANHPKSDKDTHTHTHTHSHLDISVHTQTCCQGEGKGGNEKCRHGTMTAVPPEACIWSNLATCVSHTHKHTHTSQLYLLFEPTELCRQKWAWRQRVRKIFDLTQNIYIPNSHMDSFIAESQTLTKVETFIS